MRGRPRESGVEPLHSSVPILQAMWSARRGKALQELTDPTLETAVVVREIGRAADLLGFVPALRTGRSAWLLDSALPSARLGRFSFAGADPYLEVGARGRKIRLDVRSAVRPDLAVGVRSLEGDPLDVIRSLLSPAPSVQDVRAERLPFVGGAVGCLGHGLTAFTEPIRLSLRGARLRSPDLALLFVDRLLALDHESGTLVAVGLGFARRRRDAEARAERAVSELLERLDAAPVGRPAPAQRVRRRAPSGVSATAYAARVRDVKARIEAGDVYQVCLTHRLGAVYRGDPFALYTNLRRISPAPFAAYLEIGDEVVVSSSPERFLRVDCDGRAETRPIKGTRRRGADPLTDAKQRDELVGSAKDRAENVMIVDLARNDLGKVCETGSIDVPELCAIETYATVFQLVSTVTGRLASGRGSIDLVRAAFPPGSMTGAPKLAALRILDRIEPDPRGFYGGALGYFDLRGGVDLSVVIRTLVVRAGRAELHVGGGIVADSDPAAEYEEAADKAAALLAALEAEAS